MENASQCEEKKLKNSFFLLCSSAQHLVKIREFLDLCVQLEIPRHELDSELSTCLGPFGFGDALLDGVGELLRVSDGEHMEDVPQFGARDIGENVAYDQGDASREAFQKDVGESLVERWQQCEVEGGQKSGEVLSAA